MVTWRRRASHTACRRERYREKAISRAYDAHFLLDGLCPCRRLRPVPGSAATAARVADTSGWHWVCARRGQSGAPMAHTIANGIGRADLTSLRPTIAIPNNSPWMNTRRRGLTTGGRAGQALPLQAQNVPGHGQSICTRDFRMRRHMPRSAAMCALAHCRGDDLNRVRLASILRSDICIGRARLRFAICMAGIAFVLKQ